MTNEKNNDLIVKDQSLDLVPTSLEAELIASSGNHTEKYLIENCLDREITKRQLHEILDLKERYQTNLPKIFDIMDNGYDIKQVEGFLEIRDLISTKQDSVSLLSLSKFCNKFGYDPVDTETVQGKVEELHQLMNREHYGTSISNFVDLADSFGVDSYDLVFSFLESMQASRNFQVDRNDTSVAGKRKYVCNSPTRVHRSTDNHHSYSEKSKR